MALNSDKSTIILFPTFAKLTATQSLSIPINGFSFILSSSTHSRIAASLGRHFLSPIHGSDSIRKDTFKKRVELFTEAIPVARSLRITAVIERSLDDQVSNAADTTTTTNSIAEDITRINLSEVLISEKQSKAMPPTTVKNEDRGNKPKIDAYGTVLKSTEFIDIKSGVDGLFSSNLNLYFESSPNSNLISSENRICKIRVFACMHDDENRLLPHTATSVLIPIVYEGLSIISDIDDTIKSSNVFNGLLQAAKKVLFEQQQAIPGMSQTYQRLYAKGVSFHYVSAGPFQLYPVLIEFLETFGFPLGSLHLRNVSKESSIEYKTRTILSIIDNFAKNSFYLVGDSGEKDIETYHAIKLARPERVKGIFIRSVDGGISPELLGKKDLVDDKPANPSSTWFGTIWKKEDENRDELPKSPPLVNKFVDWYLFSDPLDLENHFTENI